MTSSTRRAALWQTGAVHAARSYDRGSADLRPVTIEPGFVRTADGSALYAQGETRTICTGSRGETARRASQRPVRWLASIAVALTVSGALLAAATAGATSSSPVGTATEHRDLTISMGVSLGFGSGNNKDILHLGDSGWDNYVDGYLNQMHVSWVHLNVPWCRLEPKAGVYDRSIYEAIKSRVDRAAASGKHAFITVITHAPVFARRAAMQRDQTGKRFSSSYAGCDHPRIYPGGEPAPKRTTRALRNYAKAVGQFDDCLRGAYCSGPDVRSRVLIEAGAEANWHGGWQTGICTRNSGYEGVPWYESPGKDCGRAGVREMDSGAISHIQRKDARFFGDMANRAAYKLDGSLAFGDDVILGAPLFLRNGKGWGTGSVGGSFYLRQAVRGGSAGDPWSGSLKRRYWDVAALHVTVCDDGVKVTWNSCPGSMKEHLDEIRSTLRAAKIRVPIWISGALPCSEGASERRHGKLVKCTAESQARDVQTIIRGLRFHACADPVRPVTFLNWFRIVDPDNGKQFSGIGFMRNRASDPFVPPYVRKPPYNAMAASSHLSCVSK